MLRGGKHFQLGNPFVFENPPTLSSAAMEANQAFREGMDEAIQYIFKQEGIEIPEGASFRLTVDPDYTIHVSGLEDEKLAESIAQALLDIIDSPKKAAEFRRQWGKSAPASQNHIPGWRVSGRKLFQRPFGGAGRPTRIGEGSLGGSQETGWLHLFSLLLCL